MTFSSRTLRIFSRRPGKAVLASLFLLPILAIGEPTAHAAPAAVPLGVAAQFAVLGNSAVTNTGPSVITGDLGLSPGTSVSGFPPGIVNGTMHVDNAVAAQAQADTTIAYNNLAGQASDTNLTGQDLGGLTLNSAVYTYNVSAALTGTVTLDAQGDPNALFIFQIGSTLTTASASAVALINGAQACNVFWQVGSSATLGTTTAFVGNVLAFVSITANTGATVDGRLLASTGAVTLDTNTIDRSECAAASIPVPTVTKTASPTSRPAPGGGFTFTIDVLNSGTASATLTSLIDSVHGDLNGRGTCATGGTILAGDTYSCAFHVTFLGDGGDTETDVVTATLTDVSGDGGAGSDDATVTVTPGPTGILEICKVADNSNGRVTGNFTFTFTGRSVTVPVGACTGPLTVPAGNLTVREAPRTGSVMSACSTRPTARLVSCNPGNRSAVVSIVAGGVANETVLYVTNRRAGQPVPSTTSTTYENLGTAPIKLCKVAGRGVPVGTPFNFTVGSRTATVAAGPASQGGYCKILYGFPRGSTVTVTEAPTPNSSVQAITVRPPDRRVSSNLANRTTTVRIGPGFTVVTFTNAGGN
jgi:hypothetical protein